MQKKDIYSMKLLFTILLLMLMCLSSFSQNDTIKNDTVTAKTEKTTLKLQTVVKMPEFNGKSVAIGFSEYIQNNIVYPPKALEMGLEGIIVVYFIIDTSGNLINAKISKGIHEIVDNEILRVINSSPKWTPAISLNGKPVLISFNFPIAFTPYIKKQKKIKRRIKKELYPYN